MIRKNLGEKYVPMYHLGALGSGGLAISFFLYLNFLLPLLLIVGLGFFRFQSRRNLRIRRMNENYI